MVSLPPRYMATSSLLFLSLSLSVCLFTYLFIISFSRSPSSLLSPCTFSSFLYESFFFLSLLLSFRFITRVFLSIYISLYLSILPLRLMCSFIFHYSPVTRRALRKFSLFFHSVTYSQTHGHTHTYIHSLSHTLSLYFFLSLSLDFSVSLLRSIFFFSLFGSLPRLKPPFCLAVHIDR